MITLSATYSGSELGRALANDPEELAYALNELAEWDGGELGHEVVGYLMDDDTAIVAAFLRNMADQIDPERGP